MLLRSGLLLACTAILLQIAVYLQPLLPEKYHIAPICMSITHNLIAQSHHPVDSSHKVHDPAHHLELLHQNFSDYPQHVHDGHHQCQYCTVYGDLVPPPDLGIKAVVDRIYVQFFAFLTTFKHVYFELQRLFLMPQGRAPPLAL